MRTMQFRCFYRGVMYPVKEMQFDTDGSFSVSIIEMDLDGLGARDVSPDSAHVKGIMQFCGLHDKNGKEIFEGDVVKVISGGSDHWTREIFTVYYSEDTASFKITNKKSYPHDIDDQISYKYLEVIGNIHENPELL